MIVTLFGVGRNLNRVVRACEANGVERLECVDCKGAHLAGNLYSASGRVEIVPVPELTTEGHGAIALVPPCHKHDGEFPHVAWRGVQRIFCGGETCGLPVVPGATRVAIPMFGVQAEYTVELALGIALWEWQRYRMQPRTSYRQDVAIDLDGTLLENLREYKRFTFGAPMPGAREAVAALRAAGRKVLVHTARWPDERDAVAAHLEAHGIDVDGVLCGKPTALAYVDDKALRFDGDWQQVLDALGVDADADAG
ncbi:MAG: HAD family hydrolase [Armatimonadia bacterium]